MRHRVRSSEVPMHYTHTFIAIASALLWCPASAQVIAWQNTIGGSMSDFATAVHPTSDGGAICGGYSNSGVSGDKSEAAMGTNDFWVVKLDATGAIEWENTIGGAADDALMSMVATTDGGYVCIGHSSSNISGDKTEDSRGGSDYWVVKLDATGIITWQRTIGGSGNEQANSIIQCADGGYLCGGASASGISGEKTEALIGIQDYWVVKLDASGTIEWQNTIGGNSLEQIHSMDQTTDGGYILGGVSQSGLGGDKTEGNIGSYDLWVVKIDAGGAIQWQNTIGGANEEMLRSIQQTSDGGYICGSTSQSQMTGDKTEPSMGTFDFWPVKLDATGAIEWQNVIGGSTVDQMYSITATPDGGYLCGGMSISGIGGDKTEPMMGTYDQWVVKVDGVGHVMWQNTIGGNVDDQLRSLSVDDNGDVLVAGYSTSAATFDKTEPSQGGADYWVMKLGCTYNLIQGTAYFDINTNGIQDVSEAGVPYKQITESATGRWSYTDQDGFYSVNTGVTGNFTVQAPADVPYCDPSPLSHAVSLPALLQVDGSNDFAMQPIGTIHDLCITLTPLSAFRATTAAYYRIECRNQGTTPVDATVSFIPHPDILFISSNPGPDQVGADSLVYELGVLEPFEARVIQITVQVQTSVPVGTWLGSTARVMPLIGDVAPTCNTANAMVQTVGSFDPNDITVDRPTIEVPELSGSSWLDYVIRFQNTGTDTAFYVRVEDPISTDLRAETLEIVGTSHPCSISYVQYDEAVHFIFEDILLPDSNTNEAASHGMIRYRILPKSTLLLGDIIENRASIFFDYNPPVITNTATTEIIAATAIAEVGNDWSAYPVPATDRVNVKLVGERISPHSFRIIDGIGRSLPVVAHGSVRDGRWEGWIDVSGLTPGGYTLHGPINGNGQVIRFIKQ